MGKDIQLNDLELIIKEELEKHNNITVEASDLAESAYRTLVNVFNEEDYKVRGRVNVLKIDEDNRKYILHISKRYEDA